MSTTVQQQLQAFWDQRYGSEAFVYGTEPNAFLVQQAQYIRPGGRVLCLADGEGRNSVWLAQQGFDVSAVDISPCGVRKALQLASHAGAHVDARVADVTTLDFGVAQWDAIVSIFLHLPAGARTDVHRRCMLALRPDGVFIWEAYAPGQLGRNTGGARDAALLPALGEVMKDFAGYTQVMSWTGTRLLQEGSLHTGVGEVTQLRVTQASTPTRGDTP